MLLAAIVLQASAAGFSPPLDTALRVVTLRQEEGRSYRLERRIRFFREGTGYRAEVTLDGVDGETPDGSASLYETGFARLGGTTIGFHLDGAGTVTTIDDMPRLWALFCRRVAEGAAARRSLSPAERDRLAARVAAPLQALPADRQRAMLATLVGATILEEPLTPGTLPVRLPASSAFARYAPLDGMRTVVPLPGGLLRATTSAASDTVSIERVTEADPRTGLILRNTKIVRLRTAGQEKLSTTALTVEPVADGK